MIRDRLKSHKGKEFPRDFWNYYTNPITGFSTSEKVDIEKEELKYYKQTQKAEL